MSLPQTLFLIRLISAVLLLGLLGLIAYYLYRDATSVLSRIGVRQQFGTLRVITSTSGDPADDTYYPLESDCTIGRSSRNNIVLDDTYVSQQHARLARRHGHWWLDDLGSRNGTLLNGVPLTAETVVGNGDLITIGRVIFELESPVD